jgi:benzoyl-CoA 2,3-dioxygenase component B
MKQDPNEDVTKLGGLPLDMIQRSLNYWYSISLDLFSGEISSNAATYFASGIKGRAYEMKKYQDHLLLSDDTYDMPVVRDGKLITEKIAIRNALNEVLREEYIDDNQKSLDRWNKALEKEGIDFRLELPSRRFNRAIGEYAGHRFDPKGNLITEEEWQKHQDEWLVSEKAREYIDSIQVQVTEPEKMANWVAAPDRGIKGRPVDFEYVRL